MAILPVGGEDQPRRARLVVELDPRRDLEGLRGGLGDGQAERAAAEAGAGPVDDDPPRALAPPRPADDRPLRRVDPPDRQPAVDRHRIGALEQRPQLIDADGEAEVRRDERLHRHDPLHLPLEIQQRAAAVARLHGDRQLDHRPPLDLAPPRDAPRDDAPLEAVRIPHRHHLAAVGERGGVAESERHQALPGDADDRQVGGPVGGVDLDDVVPGAVGEFHAHRPRVADDVVVGGDEAVGADDEPGAEARVALAAAGEAHGDDRVADLGRDLLHRVAGRLLVRPARARRERERQPHQTPAEQALPRPSVPSAHRPLLVSVQPA